MIGDGKLGTFTIDELQQETKNDELLQALKRCIKKVYISQNE